MISKIHAKQAGVQRRNMRLVPRIVRMELHCRRKSSAKQTLACTEKCTEELVAAQLFPSQWRGHEKVTFIVGVAMLWLCCRKVDRVSCKCDYDSWGDWVCGDGGGKTCRIYPLKINSFQVVRREGSCDLFNVYGERVGVKRFYQSMRANIWLL